MSNQNPLVPQGSLLEQKAKGKPHLRVAYVIVALHLLFLGGLLIQGCKREDQTEASTHLAATNESTLPPLDSGSLYSTTPPASSSNAPAADLAQRGASTATNLAGQVSTAAQPAESAAREYVVLKGDSFYSIGKKFGVTTPAIARANPGIDSTRLKVGDKLQIPAAAASSGAGSSAAVAASEAGATDVYEVKPGDTLGRIAKAHGTGVTEIKSLNGLKTDRINVGQKLKLPAARVSPATAPAAALPPPPGNPPGTTVPAPTGAVRNQ